MGNGNLNNVNKFKKFTFLRKLCDTISFIKTDIDLEYYELLANAIEYGMTSNEFWNSDIQEFYCYQIAFINKSFNTSYQQGFYNHIAFSTVIANVFRDKNTPIQNYPKENIYNPFFEKMKQVQVEKQEVAKKEIDWKHIKRFLQQNSERKEENK